MRRSAIFAAGVVLAAVATATTAAAQIHDHGGPGHRSAVTTALVEARGLSSPRVPHLSARMLTRLQKAHIHVQMLSPRSAKALTDDHQVLPMSTVARQSPAFPLAAQQGRVHVSLVRLTLPNIRKVARPAARRLSESAPITDAQLAWVFTYHEDHFPFQPTYGVGARKIDPTAVPTTLYMPADMMVAFDAVTGDFLEAQTI